MRPPASAATLPGRVIHYAFLWRHERGAGLEEARYARLCLVMLARASRQAGLVQVLVVPFTTRPPASRVTAIAPPPRVRQALGLDADANWIVPGEANEFIWPGPDMQPTPDGRADYGHVPPALFEQVRVAMVEALHGGALHRVWRSV